MGHSIRNRIGVCKINSMCLKCTLRDHIYSALGGSLMHQFTRIYHSMSDKGEALCRSSAC